MISLILSLIIFFIIDITYCKLKNNNYSKKIKNIETLETKEEIKPKQYKETEENKIEENIWQIEIPKINLIAPIAEGTSQEVMLDYVGHFENTELLYGKVGLAAHNRGFPINYFARIKELVEGDEIIYKTPYGEKNYKVVSKTIIADTDWSCLQDTDKNTITLITCVENRPNKRLCIQGIEIKLLGGI